MRSHLKIEKWRVEVYPKLSSLALPLSLIGSALLTGCLSSPEVCTTGKLSSSSSGPATFQLVPSSTDLTIYPGQTEQISVFVQPIGNATGTVQLGGLNLPQGLTLSTASATIGSTANLTLTASDNVVSQCFAGIENVFTAGRAVTLFARSNNAEITTQVPLEVVLENPSFTPAATNLPVMTIDTAAHAPVDSEDDYVDATLTIKDPTNPSNNYTGTMDIKGHGNSTWNMPKKPFRLKLDSKAPLLGMTSDANWILLANYDDKTMLRNDVSLKMSEMMGMAWTPSTAFVELYINGAYNGTYELSEKVEVSKARLNIGSIDDTDNSGPNLTGGYLGEIDTYKGEDFTFTSLANLPIGIDDPDPPTIEQSTYFTTNFELAENSMYATGFADPQTGWRASWDEDSVVNYFLVEELAGNQDADDWSSDYFYKPRNDSKFYRGPVWDMDISLGNTDYGAIQDPGVPWVRTRAAWYKQLFNDPGFQSDVAARWAAVRPQIITLPAYIDTRAAALALAAQNNNGRWPTMNERVWPNPEAAGSYQAEVDYMKSWLTARIAYMDATYPPK